MNKNAGRFNCPGCAGAPPLVPPREQAVYFESTLSQHVSGPTWSWLMMARMLLLRVTAGMSTCEHYAQQATPHLGYNRANTAHSTNNCSLSGRVGAATCQEKAGCVAVVTRFSRAHCSHLELGSVCEAGVDGRQALAVVVENGLCCVPQRVVDGGGRCQCGCCAAAIAAHLTHQQLAAQHNKTTSSSMSWHVCVGICNCIFSHCPQTCACLFPNFLHLSRSTRT